MGFYNVQHHDLSYFDHLAHEYAMSDNFHQSVMGGTGANHVEIGFGTSIYYSNAQGQPAKPPQNQIENPNPQPGSNNFYQQDGYSGGSYVACADDSQPSGASIRKYLKSLPYKPFRNGDCRPGAYPGQQQPRLPGHRQACAAGPAPVHRAAHNASESGPTAQPQPHLLELLRRRLGPRQGRRRALHLLQHLRSLPVLQADHAQSTPAAAA